MLHRRGALTAIVVGLATALAGLMLLEGLSRILLTVRADLSSPEPDWYQYASDVGWDRRPLFKGLVAGELRRQDPLRYQREFDSQGFFSIDTEQIHSRAHKKVLAIGDSNTFGWGVPSRNAFPEVLDDLRPDVDVINLGVSGHTSLQGYEMLVKHFDQVRPDIVVAAYSFNDRRIVSSKEAADSRGKYERETLSHRFDLIRGKLYLYRAMQVLLSKVGLIKSGGEPNLTVDARTADTRVSPEQYRLNLERIAQFCRDRQVPVVFVVLQDNPAHTEHLRAGISHLNSGRYAEAEAALRIAVSMDNWFSDLARKYLAMALEHQGASEEARSVAALTVPAWRLTHGGRPLRLDSDYNDIVRAVGRGFGAIVVEAGQALADDASLYLDMAHPDERGHRIIATLVNRALEGLLPTPQIAAQPPSH